VTKDVPERPKKPQPVHDKPGQPEASELARTLRRELGKLGRHLLQAPAMDVDAERSGLLSPPHTPSVQPEEGDQEGNAAPARDLAEEKLFPLPRGPARDRTRGPGRGRGRSR
jgi:hypothetical protein